MPRPDDRSRERPGDAAWLAFGPPAFVFCLIYVAVAADWFLLHLANGYLFGLFCTELLPLFKAESERRERTKRRKALLDRLIAGPEQTTDENDRGRGDSDTLF